ncbi:OmpA family protein [Sulfitobacter sp. S0837]|uniref:OmpA family protein n=1 Tax=Sulfitobacter maritimus TaxID=2741719 RepID=UPI0015833952|nr:OmpA family protein [Sulfitobacter maritimus]NUH65912.1 OmpA family protein [Sulfitobacter maritimus]
MYWIDQMTLMTASPLKLIASAAALAGIAACAPTNDPVYTQFHREAGSIVDTGQFGNATLHNRQVMTGEKRVTYDMANRFASEVRSTVTFAFNSAQLDATAQAILRQQADWIRQFPEMRFRVYGHTDLVGSNAYNRALGLRRAKAVVSYLSTLGISRSRLEAVVSYGETQPLIVTQGRERRNRRTVTEVSGFARGHGQLLDGKYAEVIYREYVASAAPASTLSSMATGGGGGE